MPCAPLPPELGSAFGVAAARSAGLSRSRTRAADLESDFYGARAVRGATLASPRPHTAYPRTAEAAHIHELSHRFAVVMPPHAFFSHITALVLWDAPLPAHALAAADGDEPDRRLPLDVSVFWPRRAPRGEGVVGHAIRPQLASTRIHPVSGLTLASPATAWAMAAETLRHPYDLVAIADYFVHIRRPPPGSASSSPPLATVEQLRSAQEAGRRVGGARLAQALPLVRSGAASRTETWTRLTIIDGGLPEPQVDVDIYDRDGRFIARVDMAYPQWRIVIEYEGEHHGSAGQWELDLDRYARLEEEGWRVIRVTKRLLFQSPELLVQRVRSAIAARQR